jgi:hypothetical protein
MLRMHSSVIALVVLVVMTSPPAGPAYLIGYDPNELY